MITRLVLGSAEANTVLKLDAELQAKERDIEARYEKLRWYVYVHVSKTHIIEAATGEEAMEICAERYLGNPYDAQLVERL